jgi:hypothetical protein
LIGGSSGVIPETLAPAWLSLACIAGCTVGGVRHAGRILALVALAAAAASCGSGSSDSPVLPHNVQRAIVKKFPRLAYVPTRLPAGYHYAGHYFGRTGFDPYFSKEGHGPGQLDYAVGPLKSYTGVPLSCASLPGATKTFTLNGVKVSWTANGGGDYAWRCFDNLFDVSAGRNTAAPTAEVSTAAMVQILAYLKRIS